MSAVPSLVEGSGDARRPVRKWQRLLHTFRDSTTLVTRRTSLGIFIVLESLGCGATSPCGANPGAQTMAVFELSCREMDLTNVALSGACATFDLSCGAADLKNFFLSPGPCAMVDAGSSNYVSAYGNIYVASPTPGVCHVELTFATGFTYSTDVTFTAGTTPPGCGSPLSYVGPNPIFFTVNDPSTACEDDAAADAPSETSACPSNASQSVPCD
jgi:hypothetical protein